MSKELQNPGKLKMSFQKQYIKEKNQTNHKVEVQIQMIQTTARTIQLLPKMQIGPHTEELTQRNQYAVMLY